MKRKLRNLLTVMALCLLFTVPVAAAQTGSLTVRNIRKPVNLYQVADAAGTPNAAFSAEFEGVMTEDQLTSLLARTLYTRALEQELAGASLTPDGSQSVTFGDLKEGFYLVGSTAQPGEFAPFLVSIPMSIGDKQVYDIQAEPKTEDEPIPTEPGGAVTPNPNIPQTGAILWPKYVLLGLGAVAILAGFVLILPCRREQDG